MLEYQGFNVYGYTYLHLLVVCMLDYQVSLLCMVVGSDEEEMAEEEEKEALALQQRLAEQFDEQAYLAPEKSVSLHIASYCIAQLVEPHHLCM